MDQFKIELKESALNNAVRNFEINGTDSTDLKTFLETIMPVIEKQLKESVLNNAVRNCEVSSSGSPDLKTILSITKKNTLTPQKGGDYIDLPTTIQTKKAVINIKNKDNRSFEYAILSTQHNNEIKANHVRPSKYKAHLGKLNFTGIEFPVSLKDIDKFEKQNPGIGINVFGYDKDVHVLRLNKTDPQNAIDLMFDTNEEKQHYCWIKNFVRLVKSQVVKHHDAIYFCKRCLKHFYTTERLNNHLPICKGNPEDIKALNAKIKSKQ